jgi:hypothetical protein
MRGRGGKVGNGCKQHNCCDAIQQDEKTDGAARIPRTLPLEKEGIKFHFFSGTRWDVRHATKNFAEKAEFPLFIQRLFAIPAAPGRHAMSAFGT